MFKRSKRIARGFSAGGVFYNIRMITFLSLKTLNDIGEISIFLKNQRFFLISIVLTGKNEALVLLSSAARVSSYIVHCTILKLWFCMKITLMGDFKRNSLNT